MNKKQIVVVALAAFISFSLCESSAAAVVSDSLVVSTPVEKSEVSSSGRIKNKVDRKIEKHTFIPRGTIFAGGTIGYTSLNSSDFQFLILNDIGGDAYLLNAKVMVGYAFRDDVAAGLSFDYSRTYAKIDNIDLSLGEDLSFGIKDFSSIQHIYTGTAFLRTYINIGNSKRFGMFNDVKISFGGGQGKIVNGQGEELSGTYQKISKVGLLLSPGISVFATDFMTVEASIGILGVNYTRTEQVSNQVSTGAFESFNASFKLNILAINLGLAFYF